MTFMARIYRFFLRHTPVKGLGEIFSISEQTEPEIFFQLTKVLRTEVGQKLIIVPAQQQAPFYEYHYTAETVGKKELILKLTEKIANENELGFKLGLVLALPNKPDKLEFILQKAVEIGVGKIVLVEGDFSQLKHQVRLERLQKIVVEAAEQSERAIIPELKLDGKMRNYLDEWEKNGGESKLVVAMERSGEAQEIFKNVQKSDGLEIVIGPEGGFSPEEKQLIAKLQLTCFSLGKRVLRMETAVILSLGLASML